MLIDFPVASFGYWLHRPRSMPTVTAWVLTTLPIKAGPERMTQLGIILKTIKANELTQQKQQKRQEMALAGGEFCLVGW